MKIATFLLMLMISVMAWGNEVKIELSPARPVAGEVFQAYFRIFTDSEDEPVINFSPSNVEVAGKSHQGVSTRTVYANGKLTVTREVTIVYDLVAAKTGQAYLRDIQVQLGGRVIKHPSLTINVLKEPEVQADVFVMADLPKKSLYLGEGVVVRYFLYAKVPVNSLDVKQYPKLNKFLKRYIQEPERTERVAVDGQVYMRTQIYAAKLFPEKTGNLQIDPLRLSVTYPTARAGDPFGAFGLSRDFKTKTISSEVIDIEVKSLPAPTPEHFSGLVGVHEFQLQVGANKLIVNEPLEIKLTVSGVGALENLEAPTLIKNSGLEEFDSNGDLKINDAEKATKVFDYTFLAKENLQIPAKEITLSYFDPELGKYVPTNLSMPEIVVAGGQERPVKNVEKTIEEKKVSKVSTPITEKPKDLSAPITVEEWQWKTWLPYLNLGLVILTVILAVGWGIRNKKFIGPSLSKDIPVNFKKGQFELSEFVRWMTPVIRQCGKSPTVIIKESPISEESKRYFIDLLEANDYKTYSSQKAQLDFTYNSNHFKELSRYIESVKNVSPS